MKTALIHAEFVSRLNRFVGLVDRGGSKEKVYIPNTGRLGELLIPGREVYLSPVEGKYRHKIEYAVRHGRPIMIDAVKSNAVFHELLRNRKVPSLEGISVVRREPAVGNRRFDYLLMSGNETRLAELKSCTFVYKSIASFPDAVSDRAAEHVRILAETGNGMVFFFILAEGVTRFIPNYHTDFHFYKTLMEHKDRLEVKAFSAVYDDDMNIGGASEVEILYPEVKPVGSYMLVLYNPEERTLTV